MRPTFTFALILMMWTASLGAQQTERAPQTTLTEAQRAMVEAARRERAQRDAQRGLSMGSLTMPQAVALAGGRLTLNAAPNVDAFPEPDLASLVKKSRLVIVGRPIAPPTVHVSDDGRGIMSRYVLQVDDTIRGGTARANGIPSSVSVDVPGGSLTFPEGVAEAVNGVDLKPGQRYVLFLQRLEDDLSPDAQAELAAKRTAVGRNAAPLDASLVITGQHREGLFRVDGASVRSLAADTSSVKERYDGRGLTNLLSEVRAVR